MLELDSDLFQTAVLGALLLSLLVLLLVLNSLSKIKKTLEEALNRSPIGDITSPSLDTPATEETRVTPSQTQSEPSWSTDATTAAAASAGWGADAGSSPSQTVGASVQQAPEPQGSVRSGPDPAEMPEEQPVEHEGRWWFKRGGEMLVYDEATGQWAPSSQSSGGSEQFSGGSAYSDFKDLASGGTEAGGAGGTSGGESSGFWKCTSCGAVNGSTADSCRMCFASRP